MESIRFCQFATTFSTAKNPLTLTQNFIRACSLLFAVAFQVLVNISTQPPYASRLYCCRKLCRRQRDESVILVTLLIRVAPLFTEPPNRSALKSAQNLCPVPPQPPLQPEPCPVAKPSTPGEGINRDCFTATSARDEGYPPSRYESIRLDTSRSDFKRPPTLRPVSQRADHSRPGFRPGDSLRPTRPSESDGALLSLQHSMAASTIQAPDLQACHWHLAQSCVIPRSCFKFAPICFSGIYG